MAAQQILVLGGGFAGLWSAVGAARKLDELGVPAHEVAVTLVNRDAFHGIRVRNYEADLSDVRIPLDEILEPIGVQRIEGDVGGLDVQRRVVTLTDGPTGLVRQLTYDRLVLALGSQLVRPPVPGLSEHAFDVDVYDHAERLADHLRGLSREAPRPGQFTVVVVGAGLTGIEVATELTSRVAACVGHAPAGATARVVLVDHNAHVGSDMGDHARPFIERSLRELGVEVRTGVAVQTISEHAVTLTSGEVISAATTVWCAGMRAHALTASLPVERDRLGRVPVDASLRVKGVAHVFAAGDVARASLAPLHDSVMSCQHSRPMGRFAGHNVVCDLLGLPLLPLQIDWYVTVLDLGPAGALYTEGWERAVVATGPAAKHTKQTINRQRIYPPRSGKRAEILAAAAPIVQERPR